MNLITVQIKDIINEVEDRFSPYDLGIDNKAKDACIKKTIGVLNQKVYLPRYLEKPYGKSVSLASENVDKVLGITFNAPVSITGADTYSLDKGLIYSDLRNPFADENIMVLRSRLSMQKRTRGLALRFKYVNNILYIEDAPADSSVVNIKYLPFFNRNSEELDLYQKELDFMLDFSEAIFKEKEGAFLRKGKGLECGIDGDELVREGREDQKAILDRFVSGSAYLMGLK